MSVFDTLPLFVHAYGPLAMGNAWVEDLTPSISSYSHTLARIGGYWSASVGVKGTQNYLEEWFENGLGRRIVTMDEAGIVCWDGFVDKITLTLGGFSIARGPLTNMANRVLSVYAPLNTAVNPPTVGARTVTTWEEDLTSQYKYGILEKIISAGNTTVADAEEQRDAFLLERSTPAIGHEFSPISSGGEMSMTLECSGRSGWLNAYVYIQDAVSGVSTVTDKITDIINYSPNAYFQVSPNYIDGSLSLVPAFEADYNVAWTLIEELAKRRSINGEMYEFGVYANGRAIYKVIPNTITYMQHMADTAQRLFTMSGAEVKPWNILPGRWMMYSGIMVGRSITSTLRGDPRLSLIESVEYQAPMDFRLSGYKDMTLAERLRMLGIWGSV